MTDHPAWKRDDLDRVSRTVRTASATWLVTRVAGSGQLDIELVVGSGPPPTIDNFIPPVLPRSTRLTAALASVGPVTRVSSQDIWESLATGVLRQVIRAGQARVLYRRLCDAHGERIETSVGTMTLFPSPATVLRLSGDEFGELGLSFKRAALRAAADAVVLNHAKWTRLKPRDLVVELQSVNRIGPWTAHAAVADLTNDFGLYPYADLAVRTWAGRLVPTISWPTDEQAFAKKWRHLTGSHLSAVTAIVLAQGARS